MGVIGLVWGGAARAQLDASEEDHDAALSTLERLQSIQAEAREARLAPRAQRDALRHTGGFFRPDLGYGYLAMSGDRGRLSASGLAGFFGLHLGGTVSDGVILAAHLYDGVVVNPRVSGAGGTGTATSMTMVGLGPEVTFYSRPSNHYFSATAALTRVTLGAGGTQGSSKLGFGGQVGLGKEWWASERWGLGLVGHLSVSSNADQGGGPRLATWGAGLAFSATYN
jgi:hypothetical protein